MAWKKILTFFLAAAATLVYLSSAVEKSDNAINIAIDLGKPVSIIWPCEAAVIGDNGEKGMRIGANIGRGWRDEAGGSAGYKFYVPADGKYLIWAYALWFDECANAVFAKIDNLERAIIGNDPVYNEWHWVRGFNVDLSQGTHTIELSNHSDHIAIQKLMLINSSSTLPDQCSIVFSDIFYDGFDGCDNGNFDQWKQISGNWKVLEPQKQFCLTENALIGTSEKEALIIYPDDSFNDYSLSVSVQNIPTDDIQAGVGICLALSNENNFFELNIKPVNESGEALVKLIKKQPQSSTVLAEFNAEWQNQIWHQIHIENTNNAISIKIDKQNAVTVPISEKIEGSIGLALHGKITAYFDNIHVREMSKNKI
jgi:hypothetical protein